MITLQTICAIKGTDSIANLQASLPAGIDIISSSTANGATYAIVRLYVDDSDSSVDGFTNFASLSAWTYAIPDEAASVFSNGDVLVLSTMLRGIDQSYGVGLQ